MTSNKTIQDEWDKLCQDNSILNEEIRDLYEDHTIDSIEKKRLIEEKAILKDEIKVKQEELVDAARAKLFEDKESVQTSKMVMPNQLTREQIIDAMPLIVEVLAEYCNDRAGFRNPDTEQYHKLRSAVGFMVSCYNSIKNGPEGHPNIFTRW